MRTRVRSIFMVASAALLMANAPGSASALTLTTPAFKQNEAIPSKFTCDGPGQNPAFVFGGVPAGTKQLVLTMHDPDVPASIKADGNFDHWLVWDLPAGSKGIAEGQGGKLGINGVGMPGYFGPCPPDREHRYFFRLYALDISMAGQSFKERAALEAAIKGHVLAQAELIGRYERTKK